MSKLFLIVGDSATLDDIYQFGKENTSQSSGTTKKTIILAQGLGRYHLQKCFLKQKI